MSNLPNELRVGLESIDARHEEFWALFEKLKVASDAEFIALFEEVVEHTKAHFAQEEADMEGYANKYEHEQEHQKALEEMWYFMDKAKNGKLFFAKAYVKDRLGDWFRTHLLNMDSDLARVIRLRG